MKPWEYTIDPNQAPHKEKITVMQETELEIGLVVSDINTRIMCTLSPAEAADLARKLERASIPSVV